MNWEYRLSDKALKRLKKFPRKDMVRIYETLEAMKRDPLNIPEIERRQSH